MSIRVVFLGTGAGRPTLRRGVSSVAVVREGALYLFDCGESTQLQMMRAGVRPGPLDAVLLTHLHGDHVNGLPGLLGSFALTDRRRAVEVVGPVGTAQWLALLRELAIVWTAFDVNARDVPLDGVVLERPEFTVHARRLEHRVPTFGYALCEHPRLGRFDVERAKALGVPLGPLCGRLQKGDKVTLADGRVVLPAEVVGPARAGRKIVYCTDTSPCEAAIDLARDADLLIHDATYPAGEEARALEHGHATAGDAARCAAAAGAKQLVLTHISQGTATLDEHLAGARAIFPATIAAFDLMEIDLGHGP